MIPNVFLYKQEMLTAEEWQHLEAESEPQEYGKRQFEAEKRKIGSAVAS